MFYIYPEFQAGLLSYWYYITFVLLLNVAADHDIFTEISDPDPF
jgi:hypothetical protein